MRWSKKGLVWSNPGIGSWGTTSALTPTPFHLSTDVIRIFAGFRDKSGVSRIGYVDLAATDPTHVLGVSETPILEIGRDGCFDDNGVILGDVIRTDHEIRMYYIGFQLVQKVKFLAFTGLAISKDNGNSFERFSEVPILDRVAGASTIHALHSIQRTENGWLAWAARGEGWEIRQGKPYPRYEIWQMSSADGLQFNQAQKVVSVRNNEYRIGRPSVFKRPDGKLGMFYTAGYLDNDRYDAGLAVSDDGITWRRMDQDIGLTTSGTDAFDRLHLCYPRIFKAGNRHFAVYNGNNMGIEGFGLAELLEW